jgi:hypothetical protein
MFVRRARYFSTPASRSCRTAGLTGSAHKRTRDIGVSAERPGLGLSIQAHDAAHVAPRGRCLTCGARADDQQCRQLREELAQARISQARDVVGGRHRGQDSDFAATSVPFWRTWQPRFREACRSRGSSGVDVPCNRLTGKVADRAPFLLGTPLRRSIEVRGRAKAQSRRCPSTGERGSTDPAALRLREVIATFGLGCEGVGNLGGDLLTRLRPRVPIGRPFYLCLRHSSPPRTACGNGRGAPWRESQTSFRPRAHLRFMG